MVTSASTSRVCTATIVPRAVRTIIVDFVSYSKLAADGTGIPVSDYIILGLCNMPFKFRNRSSACAAAARLQTTGDFDFQPELNSAMSIRLHR